MKAGDALKVKCDTAYFFSILLKYSKYRQLHKSLIDGLIHFLQNGVRGVETHLSFFLQVKTQTP